MKPKSYLALLCIALFLFVAFGRCNDSRGDQDDGMPKNKKYEKYYDYRDCTSKLLQRKYGVPPIRSI